MGSHRVTCHLAEAASPTFTPSVTGWYSIYPPVKDEKLSLCLIIMHYHHWNPQYYVKRFILLTLVILKVFLGYRGL